MFDQSETIVNLKTNASAYFSWQSIETCSIGFSSVFNILNTKIHFVSLVVMPTFTVTPTMADKYPQESVTFKCSATGTPTPEIAWFHNGQKVPPSTTGRIQINSKNDLTFISLQSGDKGSVQCAATNDAGEILSRALLRVKGEKCIGCFPVIDLYKKKSTRLSKGGK